jgi:hypothetical protein
MSSEPNESQGSQWAGERSHAFLLRCWLEPDEKPVGAPVWRFSLTHINAQKKKKAFVDLDALLAYLHQVLAKEKD